MVRLRTEIGLFAVSLETVVSQSFKPSRRAIGVPISIVAEEHCRRISERRIGLAWEWRGAVPDLRYRAGQSGDGRLDAA